MLDKGTKIERTEMGEIRPIYDGAEETEPNQFSWKKSGKKLKQIEQANIVPSVWTLMLLLMPVGNAKVSVCWNVEKFIETMIEIEHKNRMTVRRDLVSPVAIQVG